MKLKELELQQTCVFFKLEWQKDLQWNQFWYKFVKKGIDSLSKARVSCPQSHAAIAKEPAAKGQKTRCSVMTKATELQEQRRHTVSLNTGQSFPYSKMWLFHPDFTQL